MTTKPKGTLIIIGGHEAKAAHGAILTEVAKYAQQGKNHLVIMTVASQEPKELSEEYTSIFLEMGVKRVDTIDLRTRAEAHDEKHLKTIQQASLIFFTGGDQLRITSQLGDTPLFQSLWKYYEQGGIIAGSSAGAAVMPQTMIIGGPSDESSRISTLSMAPGLGLITDVAIDSHFAQRGRIGRLLGVVAQNPSNLGLGIDEDTAIVVTGQQRFSVLGSGAVYVVDGSEISYSSLSEAQSDGIVSIYNIRLHVLGAEDCFDLIKRHPERPKQSKQTEAQATK